MVDPNVRYVLRWAEGREYFVPLEMIEDWQAWVHQLEKMDEASIEWDPPPGIIELEYFEDYSFTGVTPQ